MKSKSKTFTEFMLEKKEYFIRSSGKGEMKLYYLIKKSTFDTLDIFFQTEDDAKEFAQKHDLKIVEYKED